MIAFVLLVVVLIVRPQGLFGRSDAGRSDHVIGNVR